MSRIDEKLRDEAAIYLEEMGVSGDAQIGIDAEHAPHKEMIGGAYHIHDLLADYAQSQLQELREWLEKQQKQSLEAVKDSVTDSEQEFFHGCRQMAKDTLDKLDNLNG